MSSSDTNVGVAAGDADFASNFLAEYPRLVNELQYIIGNREIAKELAQEAFGLQYMHWTKVKKYDRPGAWVRRVAIRLATRKRRNVIRESEFYQAAESVSQPNTEIIIDIRNAVLQLPPMQRAAIVYRYYRDMSVVSIADALSVREATAKVHLHRGRQRLAELLSDYAPSS